MGKREPLIQEAFFSLSIEMLKSPAYFELGLTERRILDCFMVEFSNQRRQYVPLVVTYETLIAFGIDRGSIAPAYRVLKDLGFIKIEHGRGDNGGDHTPNKVLLTFAYTDRKHLPSHDWRRIIKEDVPRIRSAARARKDPRCVARGRKYNPKRRRPNFKVIESNIKTVYGGDWFSSRIIGPDEVAQ
jgi:hypothetical protein